MLNGALKFFQIFVYSCLNKYRSIGLQLVKLSFFTQVRQIMKNQRHSTFYAVQCKTLASLNHLTVFSEFGTKIDTSERVWAKFWVLIKILVVIASFVKLKDKRKDDS